MSLLAKSVIKNKCWIVEEDGTKVATILASPVGVTYVHGTKRENFPNLKLLSDRYNIHIDKSKKEAIKRDPYDVYGYPSSAKVYNRLWDVQKKIPIFTKHPKSKSYFCAGYYLVKMNGQWTEVFCPKLITVNRYSFYGPYRTEEEMKSKTIAMDKDDPYGSY